MKLLINNARLGLRANRRLTLLGLTLLLSSLSFAQSNSKVNLLDPFLDQMDLQFYMPTENAFQFSKIRDNDFFKYDSKIKAKSKEMEVLIALHPDGERPFTSNFPHLEFNRLLANMTPNDNEQEVLVIGWREPKLLTRNADWGAEAYFTPRKQITDFPFAKLIAFFKEGKGMVVMLYCFDDPDQVPKLLAFMDEDDKN